LQVPLRELEAPAEGDATVAADGTRDRLVEALRWAWEGLYQITAAADGRLEAWRLDGSAAVLADSPEELRDAIREDYPKYLTATAL
jgi:hypothetical protein